MFKFYISNRGNPAISFNAKNATLVQRALKSVNVYVQNKYTKGSLCTFYLPYSAAEKRTKIQAALNEAKRQAFNPPESKPTPPAVKPTPTPAPKPEPEPEPFKLLTQRQLQYRVRNKPEEAVHYIYFHCEDEEFLEQIVFGDWTIEEVQTFDVEEWIKFMYIYGLRELIESSKLYQKDLGRFVAYILPSIYKAARESMLAMKRHQQKINTAILAANAVA